MYNDVYTFLRFLDKLIVVMRNRTICFGFLSVILWAIITYVLIFHQSTNIKKKQFRITTQVNRDTNDLTELVDFNKKILNDFDSEHLSSHSDILNLTLVTIATKVFTQDTSYNYMGKFEQSIANKSMFKLSGEKKHPIIYGNWNQKQSAVLYKTGLPIIAVLVISCNRVTVQRCLDQLIKFRPSIYNFPIIVSQDCAHQPTAEIIRSFGKMVIHIQQPDQSDIEVPATEKKFQGYFKIARHYRWALNEIFFKFGFQTAIVIEDDLDISPDFFEYFSGTLPILLKDPSIWCVSAWNDNGKSNLVDLKKPHVLYRTDFFPGLGWMLTRKLWKELYLKWPKSYWDDWIRQPEQRKNRACIRPELSRTRTFGKIGVSNGLFYEKHLQFIKLNENFIPFTKLNLTYLLKDQYDISFINEVYRSELITHVDLKTSTIKDSTKTFRIQYYTRQSYKYTARILNLMDDFKSGVPRTGYRGVVTVFFNGRRLYLAPSSSWTGYNISWR